VQALQHVRSTSEATVRTARAPKVQALRHVRSTSVATVRRALKVQALRHVRSISVVIVRRDRHAMVRHALESSASVRRPAHTRLTRERDWHV
jgi:hypothetical protein